MKFKSLFVCTKEQRKGIFVFLLLVIILQCLAYFIDFPAKEHKVDSTQLEEYRTEIENLRCVALQERIPKIYPFNPNYISDYKGYKLGMQSEEIDRLIKFRATNKWVNSAKEFQQVTKISDSLLAILSPYFKFPEWVTQSKTKSKKVFNTRDKPKSYAQKTDLNTATISELRKVYGIGEKLSQRIITYREKNNGFVSTIELLEVYGLSLEVIENIKKHFVVRTPKAIKQLNINTATRDQLVTIKYIDYEIAHAIIEQRTLREGFKSIEELIKVKGFPIEKIEIIRLYLTL